MNAEYCFAQYTKFTVTRLEFTFSEEHGFSRVIKSEIEEMDFSP